MFSRSHVLLDNQASVSIFSNRDLLTNVKLSKNQIVLNGVQSNAKGVRVDQEGQFNEIGNVYYSENATANILSFAAMVDEGAQIRYNQKGSQFTLQPAVSADRAYQTVKVDSMSVMCDQRFQITQQVTQHANMHWCRPCPTT